MLCAPKQILPEIRFTFAFVYVSQHCLFQLDVHRPAELKILRYHGNPGAITRFCSSKSWLVVGWRRRLRVGSSCERSMKKWRIQRLSWYEAGCFGDVITRKSNFPSLLQMPVVPMPTSDRALGCCSTRQVSASLNIIGSAWRGPEFLQNGSGRGSTPSQHYKNMMCKMPRVSPRWLLNGTAFRMCRPCDSRRGQCTTIVGVLSP